MKFIIRWVVLLMCVVALVGCAARKSPTVTTMVTGEHQSDVQQERMLIWKADLRIEVADLGKADHEATAKVETLGGYVEQKSNNGDKSINFKLRIPSKSFKAAVSSLESLGKVNYRNLTGEDVTEHYVDVDAQVKNLIALRDRLKQHLDKAADVKDIIAIETELNRVQTEIDSLQGQLKSLKGKADYATIDLTLERHAILGPLGYIFHGIGWCLEKLFVLRE